MMDISSAIFSIAPRLQDAAKRSDTHLVVQCPFHGGGNERTPSCSIRLDAPVFRCFACHTSGHVSLFLKQLGLGTDAIKTILKTTGLDRPYTPKNHRLTARLTGGFNVFRGPFILHEDLLDEYRHAPKMLIRQGFEKRTLRHFEVGYDHHNLRITFPLRNVYGELVGISGRAVLDYQEPRYKIYDREMKVRRGFEIPQEYSMAEVKDAVLWHAHVVRPFFYSRVPDDSPLVLTEGFKACMWTWQSGYESVVALIGSSLSELHAELIASAVQHVVLFLDNNEAGWRGTYKAGALLSTYGIDVRVAQYPDERQQPDDLDREETLLSINNPERYILWRQREHVQAIIHEDAQRRWNNAPNERSAPTRR